MTETGARAAIRVGYRVILSEAGRRYYPRMPATREGVVTAITRNGRRYVKWDGARRSQLFYPQYLAVTERRA
jgi:hypothetical protein